MWHFGIRQLKQGGFILTEEFPRLAKNAYAICGQIEEYTKKELKLLAQDILHILKKGKIKKAVDAGDFISQELEHRRIQKLMEPKKTPKVIIPKKEGVKKYDSCRKS